MHRVSLGCSCSIGRRWPSYDTLPGLRLTVVVENRAGPGCCGAHGFAAWLEAGSAVVLVDTGPDPDLLAQNAAALGLDLGRVEAVVLSHGHDDHSGGLPAVVAARAGCPLSVVMHPAATRRRFSRRTGLPRPIGMPDASQEALRSPGVEVVTSLQPTCVIPGIWATGAIPRRQENPGETYLVLDPTGRKPDPLDDDQAVVVDTEHGLVVVCGCAHAGIANTLDHIAKIRPGAPIALLAGGLHLGTAAESPTLIGLCDDLGRRQIARYALGHCTGERAERFLAQHLGGTVTTLNCGTRLEIP
ncbi:MAG TPA: MBL fold metallo-hydrolase [Planctomycetes bacterium]|nr:MBL fold metallo-hydrolase [Planctomycetota bacterium]